MLNALKLWVDCIPLVSIEEDSYECLPLLKPRTQLGYIALPQLAFINQTLKTILGVFTQVHSLFPLHSCRLSPLVRQPPLLQALNNPAAELSVKAASQVTNSSSQALSSLTSYFNSRLFPGFSRFCQLYFLGSSLSTSSFSFRWPTATQTPIQYGAQ